MPQPYQHLFFDLDHTLWDFDANARHTLEELYRQFELEAKGICGFELFFQRYCTHNERLWKRYVQGFIRQEELRWKRMWHTLLEDKLADEALSKTLSLAYLEGLPQRTRLFDHTLETLDYLQAKGYQLHIITNGFADVQHQKLKNSLLLPYFTHIVTSEECGYKKPDKAIFAHAMKLAGTGPESSIMIGDNLEADVAGAINAGMDNIFVNHTGYALPVTATYTITGLDQLRTIL